MNTTTCDACGKARPQYWDEDRGDEFYEWIALHQRGANDETDLCSWACLATWAVAKTVDIEVQR